MSFFSLSTIKESCFVCCQVTKRYSSSLYPLQKTCTFSPPFCARLAKGAKILTREIEFGLKRRVFYPDPLRFAGVVREKPILANTYTSLCICMTAYKLSALQWQKEQTPFNPVFKWLPWCGGRNLPYLITLHWPLAYTTTCTIVQSVMSDTSGRWRLSSVG